MHGSASASQKRGITINAPWFEEAIFLRGAPPFILKNTDLVSHMLNTAFSHCLNFCPGKRSARSGNSCLIATRTVLFAKNLKSEAPSYKVLRVKFQRLKIPPTFCLLFGFLILIVA